MKKLTATIETVYGKQRINLSDCPEAKAIKSLTRRATVGASDVEPLKALGFEIEATVKTPVIAGITVKVS
jgi:hypothetical protein